MDKFYLSTIDENAHLLAKKHGFGIEIAEFCTPWFLDTDFAEIDPKIHINRKFIVIFRRII